MTATIDAATLKAWLSDGGEIALLDVREAGQFGEGHLFFAVPLPYSRFELALPALVPNPAVRLVLCDGGEDAIAARAAKRAEALGYRNVHVLAGGTQAWQRAGYTLYAGVNVPSKTFGELVEHERHTPRITAQDLEAMRRAGRELRHRRRPALRRIPQDEHPGRHLLPERRAGAAHRRHRPRSQDQDRRQLRGPHALHHRRADADRFRRRQSGGSAGERHAGLDAGRARSSSTARAGAMPTESGSPTSRPARHARGRWPRRTASRSSRPRRPRRWLADASRTTYLLDVRTAEEFAASAVPGFAHAPGGQLVQATDQWVGVKGARLVLLDEEGVRAPVIAGWLRQLGHEACVLEGGVAAAAQVARPQRAVASSPAGACGDDARGTGRRPAPGHRAGHRPAPGHDLPRGAHRAGPLVDPAADRARPSRTPRRPSRSSPTSAAWRRWRRSISPSTAAVTSACWKAGHEAWRAAGLPVVATPDDPPDADCIDFLFFTHGRHEGNAEAARQYLAWEIGLIAQLDAQERGAFRI